MALVAVLLGVPATLACYAAADKVQTIAQCSLRVGRLHGSLRAGCSSMLHLTPCNEMHCHADGPRIMLSCLASYLDPAATPSLDSQRQRFLDCGWHRAEARSMDNVYRWAAHCVHWGDYSGKRKLTCPHARVPTQSHAHTEKLLRQPMHSNARPLASSPVLLAQPVHRPGGPAAHRAAGDL